MSIAKDVTDATFTADVLRADKTVLVDFWAAWCGPCRAVSPILDQIAAEHPDEITVTKVNVDLNPDLADRHGVVSIPTLIVFRDGTATTPGAPVTANEVPASLATTGTVQYRTEPSAYCAATVTDHASPPSFAVRTAVTD